MQCLRSPKQNQMYVLSTHVHNNVHVRMKQRKDFFYAISSVLLRPTNACAKLEISCWITNPYLGLLILDIFVIDDPLIDCGGEIRSENKRLIVLMSSKQKSVLFFQFIAWCKEPETRGILSTNIFMFTLRVLISHFCVGSAYSEIISTLTQHMKAKMCWKNLKLKISVLTLCLHLTLLLASDPCTWEEDQSVHLCLCPPLHISGWLWPLYLGGGSVCASMSLPTPP